MILIDPKHCLHDEKINIFVEKLEPFQKVTISCHAKDNRGKGYYSYAYYVADCNGVINVKNDYSHGGTYEGVFQMGLIFGLSPEPNENQYLRFFQKDVTVPNKFTFNIFNYHLLPSEIFQQHVTPLFSAFHFRHFLAPGVKRIPIRSGKVRGTLFLPPGDGIFPGIVDMFGTAGGCLEYRSALLASHGIASLALAFFAYEDLPSIPRQFEMAYFREAVNILLGFKQVHTSVGVIGTSKGGDLALSMAVHISDVALAVSINGCYCNLSYPLKMENGSVFPALNFDMAHIKINPDRTLSAFGSQHSPEDYPETIIPIHQTMADIVFIVGEDDQNYNSLHYARKAEKLMLCHGKTNYQVLSYRNAGHLIEPPYSAFCPASYHKVLDFNLTWGGVLKDHNMAQEHSWKFLIDLIKSKLQPHKSKL